MYICLEDAIQALLVLLLKTRSSDERILYPCKVRVGRLDSSKSSMPQTSGGNDPSRMRHHTDSSSSGSWRQDEDDSIQTKDRSDFVSFQQNDGSHRSTFQIRETTEEDLRVHGRRDRI